MNTILLTFDVEDWFQVENFKPYIPFSSWSKFELRVEKNVHIILDLLDSIRSRTSPLAPHGFNSLFCALRSAPCVSMRGTFFVLGWIAERLPHLVREINSRGHEVASHGYGHKLCNAQNISEVKKDLEKSKKLLEDILGSPIYGYRAPNFSINEEVLMAIAEAGYNYDSSYNSYRLNKRYGQISLFNNHDGFPYKIFDSFYEFPISNLKIGNRVLHWGGGGYFRLMPINIFISGVKRILKNNGIYMLYLHPWEFDPDQPKMLQISNFLKFRHYFNLEKTSIKFQIFLNYFNKCQFLTCLDFLNLNTQHLTLSTKH